MILIDRALEVVAPRLFAAYTAASCFFILVCVIKKVIVVSVVLALGLSTMSSETICWLFVIFQNCSAFACIFGADLDVRATSSNRFFNSVILLCSQSIDVYLVMLGCPM